MIWRSWGRQLLDWKISWTNWAAEEKKLQQTIVYMLFFQVLIMNPACKFSHFWILNFYFPFRNLWFQSPLRIFRYVKPVSNSFIWISSLIRLLPFQFIVFVSITTKITNYIDLRHRIGYGFWLCCYTSATPMGSSCLVWNQLYLQNRTLSELVILWCIASRA